MRTILYYTGKITLLCKLPLRADALAGRPGALNLQSFAEIGNNDTFRQQITT